MKLYGILYITVWCFLREITDAESTVHCFRMKRTDGSCGNVMRLQKENSAACCARHNAVGYAESLQDSGSGENSYVCIPCPTMDADAATTTSTTPALTVNGRWGDWSGWYPCDATCGGGTKVRVRDCDNPPPENGGRGCTGECYKLKQCNSKECPVDGVWTDWGDYGFCDVTCGVGVKVRRRQCTGPQYGGSDCQGRTEEERQCTMPSCQVDGHWSVWGGWGACSVSCGEGHRDRSRTCDDPPPKHGGEYCRGDEQETSRCTMVEDCPVDGGWSLWTDYGSCRANPCKSFPGYRFRTRECGDPVPRYGGATCDGIRVERELCYNTHRCPLEVHGGWCPWSSWGECVGEQHIRSRGCECPRPHLGGKECLVNATTAEVGMRRDDFKNCIFEVGSGSGSGQGEDDDSDDGGSEEVAGVADREP